jgi:hypothetical protein
MVVTNMRIHPKRISPARETYCSSLLTASIPSTRNAPNELLRLVYPSFWFVAAEKIVSVHLAHTAQSNPAQFQDFDPAMI